ncbi:hypothetical protein niasHS_009323 [Heterodera schachtii]|uniref:Uncharacterized protein n=1 Tax=Heterodera schachtii TaxID=97005 RepID=A0ABD2JBT1_HETSC
MANYFARIDLALPTVDAREEAADYQINNQFEYQALIPRLRQHRDVGQFFYNLYSQNNTNSYEQNVDETHVRYLISLRARVEGGVENVRNYFNLNGVISAYSSRFNCDFVFIMPGGSVPWDIAQVTFSVETVVNNCTALMEFIFFRVITMIESGDEPQIPPTQSDSPPNLAE